MRACATRSPGSARRSSERERNLSRPERHIAIIRRSGYRGGQIWPRFEGTCPVLVNRREFVVSTAALIAAAALFGSTPLALADPTPEELMRAGPLPDIVLGTEDAPVTIVEYAEIACP